MADVSEKPWHWMTAAWLLERKYPEEYGRPEARSAKSVEDSVSQIALSWRCV